MQDSGYRIQETVDADMVDQKWYTSVMPSVNEVKAVLDRPHLELLRRISKRNGVSLSRLIRDLIISSLEEMEDLILDEIGTERFKTYDDKKAISPEQLKRKLSLKK